MLSNYFTEIERIRGIGKDWNLTDEEIDRIIDESFRFLEADGFQDEQDTLQKRKSQISLIGLSIVICLVAVLFGLLFTYRKTAHNYLERNIQELIYPGMKLLRKIMLPIVKTFPSITEWYDEACLISNPYFRVSDIDCWPCKGVRSVLNLTQSNLMSKEFHTGIPFIIKDETLKLVRFRDLKNMYNSKKDMFDRDAPRIESTGGWSTSEDIFYNKPLNTNPSQARDVHTSWKLNRLEPTREVRKLFGFPKKLPNYVSGVTPEKYILIDEKLSPPYQIPGTEGTTVFLVQGSGTRLVILEPSAECQSSCHRVSVLLTPNHILWYNWWYWRATSAPSESGRLSVTYLGSYY
ncbi:uncharacterized protein LOC106666266 [Cimex lectularius]|uniref:Uncharacterized protein n=1 Tax=Cimex lectularius TaxID=79782 RepID=A0A8I6RP18_CIMLE|nr:uncharacterized protein LOC106666266 [Cimex lectularius]